MGYVLHLISKFVMMIKMTMEFVMMIKMMMMMMMMMEVYNNDYRRYQHYKSNSN